MAKPAKKAAAADTTGSTLPAVMVPLSQLFPHPLNTRAETPAPDEIAELAESIRTCGLMQNLLGLRDPDVADQIGIVAGGRRLAALRMIHADDGDDPLVPVVVTYDAETAQIWAGAENTARKPLRPVDEIRAYGKMAAAGSSANAIARAFAVTERHVLGRLKLSHLPDRALDALRDGKISLDQAAALTTAPGDELLLQVLDTVLASEKWPTTPARIRAMLAPDAVALDYRRAQLVGTDAYVAAGGRIQHDLSSAEISLLDPHILDTCFADRTAAMIDEYKSIGWQDARCSADAYRDWQAVQGWSSVQRTPGTLTDAETAEMEGLAAMAEADGMTAEQAARYDQLDAILTGEWTAEDRATSTLFFHIDRDGATIIDGAYRPPVAAAQPDSAADPDQLAATAAEPDKISNGLRDDLRRVLTLALQEKLMHSPTTCLDLLALTLTRADLSVWARPLAISATRQSIIPDKPTGTSQIGGLLDALPDATAGGGAELSIQMLDDIRGNAVATDQALTAALARTFCRADTPFGMALADRLGVNPRDVWTPTADGYFGRLPPAMLDRLWSDLTAGIPSDFHKLKKVEKARELEKLFIDTAFQRAIGLTDGQIAALDAWLPPELTITIKGAA